MSKRMETEELKRHVAEAIHELDNLLSSWMGSSNDVDKKRAQLLSYWVKTYTSMIRRENDFNPASIPRLARRQIVNVDFGFRVGSELGGPALCCGFGQRKRTEGRHCDCGSARFLKGTS